ncbi:hypothetical protein D5S17_14545 [Pseudonocardiaceae bacterium YIM PH 21723]|nr:hypothetical protein D5S17_14545 [Pseudonocardiaceae bacterium YIM PH 21723]
MSPTDPLRQESSASSARATWRVDVEVKQASDSAGEWLTGELIEVLWDLLAWAHQDRAEDEGRSS